MGLSSCARIVGMSCLQANHLRGCAPRLCRIAQAVCIPRQRPGDCSQEHRYLPTGWRRMSGSVVAHRATTQVGSVNSE